MTTETPAAAVPDARPVAVPADAPRSTSWLAPGVMGVAVVVAAVLPFAGDRRFYLADDTTGAWLPVSRRIGDLILSGESHLMDPELWRGGNFIASARYGIWNPLVLLLDVTVLQLDDLAVAMLLVSALFMLILAAGVYLLAREYGAGPWPAAVVGLAAATGGWTLWIDAAWWTPHLASLALTPFVWVTARRTARGVGSPGWFVVAAALCVTIGNPYSVVIVIVIVAGVIAEVFRGRGTAAVWMLVSALVSIGLISIFVYLPFQQTSSVGFRESGIFNDETWAPGAGDLLTMSSPTARPFVSNFGRDMLGFPAMYLSWFALPLIPWLKWRTLARREFLGVAAVAGTVLVLVLGPSNFWFFRWPIRLLPYLYLPMLVALAVLLTAGLRRDRIRQHALTSAAIVLGGAYLAWADVPDELSWHLVATAAVAVATTVTLFVAVRHPSATGAVMMGFTLVVLAVQLQWRPVNASLSSYWMPTTASAYVENFAERYDGTVMQIASPDAIPWPDRSPEGAYRDITVGSTYAIADVEALTAYSAIGFVTHDSALCIAFDGRVCASGFDRLFQPAPGSDRLLVDLVGIETVVVQTSLVDTTEQLAPAGWSIAEVTPHVVVWKREQPLAWPDSRLSAVNGPVTVTVAAQDGPHRESVRFERSGDGPAQLTFARLAWPGYEASANGRVLPVGGDGAGLVTVTLPADLGDGEVVVTWTPPYWRPSLAILLLGVLVAVGTQAAWWWSRRPDRTVAPRG